MTTNMMNFNTQKPSIDIQQDLKNSGFDTGASEGIGALDADFTGEYGSLTADELSSSFEFESLLDSTEYSNSMERFLNTLPEYNPEEAVDTLNAQLDEVTGRLGTGLLTETEANNFESDLTQHFFMNDFKISADESEALSLFSDLKEAHFSTQPGPSPDGTDSPETALSDFFEHNVSTLDLLDGHHNIQQALNRDGQNLITDQAFDLKMAELKAEGGETSTADLLDLAYLNGVANRPDPTAALTQEQVEIGARIDAYKADPDAFSIGESVRLQYQVAFAFEPELSFENPLV